MSELKSSHVFSSTTTQHCEASRNFGAKVLQYSAKHFTLVGQIWMKDEGGKKKFTAEDLIEDYEKSL